MRKVAIVYDRVNKWGGAERVLLALHKIFPKAQLFTSVCDLNLAPWAKVFPEIRTSFLQKIPFARSNHEFFAILMPFAFGSLDLSEFDIVISVTSEAAKGVKIRSNALHVCYCLTPTRYLWSHYNEYFKNPLFKAISKPFVNWLRKWDKKAAKRPDIMIAISSEVRDRIKKYYGRDSKIIFPPVSFHKHSFKVKKQKYFLLVSRLDYGYKKVELAIEAFNKLKKPLVIVGTGRQEKKLKSMAKKNIKFVGRVSEKELDRYYQNARALIMPQEEDFGIVAVEAQAHGTPVIAYEKGGACDTVIEGKTGVFFGEQTTESLIYAVKKFDKMKFIGNNLYTNAKRFSFQEFKKEFSRIL